jgi:DeoR/GlpR family transcriptional regulator of sugar metabolism
MAAKEYECIDLVSGSAGAALANRLSEEASVIEVRTNSVPIYGGRRDQ